MIQANKRHRGILLIDMMMSVVVLAVIMGAAAVAFNGGLDGYTQNKYMAQASQSARASLQRMMREVRSSQALTADPNGVVTIIPQANSIGLQLITYGYDANTHQLNCTRKVSGVSTNTIVLGSGGELTSFTITPTTGQDWQGYTCVKTMTVQLGLTFNRQVFYITASDSPRTNQLF
jgi:hypothetical protein